ncbi:hypothetical protein BGZ65_001518 [Modicella reniformis]|uniref:Uncharacterized protein n=1 Tax=Modicella reniformis TaxID=1440133 RepID=A0A9P6MJB3_9FUNG|nr:hypothetical protein BGZ65_001518 [Modicella reniformis]
MLVNVGQGPHNFDRSHRSGSHHRRSVSCVASHDEFIYFPIGILEEGDIATTAIATGDDGSSASSARQASRMTDGVSIIQLQRSAADNGDSVVIATGSFGGKIKLSPGALGPRKSLLSDMLNSSQNNQIERNAHRRRMLKSMRRYSVDASEMNIDLGRTLPQKGPSESEAAGGAPEFRDTPTVRYLRNPCYATVKTKLIPTAVRRGAGGDNETTDYFGTEDRVW